MLRKDFLDRGFSTISTVLTVAIAVLAVFYLWVWFFDIFAVIFPDAGSVPVSFSVLAPLCTYDQSSGALETCVTVRNLGDRKIEANSITAYVVSDSVPLTEAVYTSGGDIAPGQAGRICFSSNPLPPGEYSLRLASTEGYQTVTNFTISPYCNSDADCPDTVLLDGNLLEYKDMYCAEKGYCDANYTDIYVCDETNANVCSAVSFLEEEYYCAWSSDTETSWTETLSDNPLDLKDNDCDGTVMRICDSCASCTYELNHVAKNLVTQGYDVNVLLSSDIVVQTATELVESDGYWCATATCIVAENYPDATGGVTFDLNDHVIDLYSYGLDGDSMDFYDTEATAHLKVLNARTRGRVCADIGTAGLIFDNISVEVDILDTGILIADYNVVMHHFSVKCNSGADFGVYLIAGKVALKDGNITGHCPYGIYAFLSNNNLLFEDVNVFLSSGYDMRFPPKYHTINNLRCTNGKFVQYNVATVDSNTCGIIYNANSAVIDLNGQTITGYGVGFDEGNVVLRGPGVITGNAVGLYLDTYLESLVVDLAYGDINICGNETDVFFAPGSPDLNCINCGGGHYLRYNKTNDADSIICDPSCIAPCG